jgi:hypothetical protein
MKPVIYSDFNWQPKLTDRDVQIAIMVDYRPEQDAFWEAPIRIFVQAEPPCVRPDVLARLSKEQSRFTAILGWHSSLRDCPNASYFNLCTETRLGENYQPLADKKFGASYLISTKAWCPGHIFRQAVFDAVGSFDGFEIAKLKNLPSQYIEKADFIGHYQFDISIENEFIENWFTDKIIDAWVAKVVPIYCGCPNLADFGFDTSGVLYFSSIDDLKGLLQRITPNTYASMSVAIETNYNLAKKWIDPWLLDKEITRILEGN